VIEIKDHVCIVCGTFSNRKKCPSCGARTMKLGVA